VVVGEITWDGLLGVTGYTHGNGVRTEFRHGRDGKVVAIESRSVLKLEYRYDALGRIVGLAVDGRVSRYGYDALGRLVRAETPEGSLAYRYDAAGNRVFKAERGADGRTRTQAYRYPEPGQGNRLLEVVTSADSAGGRRGEGVEKRRYTPTGTPVEIDGLGYRYDSGRRPVEVQRHGVKVAAYRYNTFGERIEKVVYSPTRGGRSRVTYFLYDGHRLTAEGSPGGEVGAQYIYLAGRPVALLRGRELYALHSDHLGTPRAATDEAGQVVWAADYTPFGEAGITRQDIVLNLRFPGQYYDAETGTHYNYLRDYDPRTGRYLTADPIGVRGGLNTYAYAEGNPLALADPLGLAAEGSLVVGGVDDSTLVGRAINRAESYGLDTGEVMDGFAMVPKPLPADSTFVRKLDAVFAEAAFQLQNNPDYSGDRALSDLLTALRNDLPYIAGALLMFTAAQVFIPPPFNAALDTILLVAAGTMVGIEGVAFITKLIGLALRVSGTEECDGQALQGLGEQLARDVWNAGIKVAEGATLGMFGAIGRVGRLFPDGALQRRTGRVKGDSYEELKKSTQDNLGGLPLRVVPSRTVPTGPKGGKPTGTRTEIKGSAEKKRGLRRENESADILANAGYRVEQNPGRRFNGKDPDYRIEGRYFDNYAPISNNVGKIRNKISKKVGDDQAPRIVVNLADTTVTADQIRARLLRDPVGGLEEVIAITRTGEIVQVFP